MSTLSVHVVAIFRDGTRSTFDASLPAGPRYMPSLAASVKAELGGRIPMRLILITGFDVYDYTPSEVLEVLELAA